MDKRHERKDSQWVPSPGASDLTSVSSFPYRCYENNENQLAKVSLTPGQCPISVCAVIRATAIPRTFSPDYIQ